MAEENKKQIPHPAIEFTIAPRKVTIISETGLHNTELITKIEQNEGRILEKQEFFKKKNPDKTVLFQLKNKYDEQIQIAHYKGNDFLNLFIDGGVHHTRFVLSKNLAEHLVHVLLRYLEGQKIGEN